MPLISSGSVRLGQAFFKKTEVAITRQCRHFLFNQGMAGEFTLIKGGWFSFHLQ